MLSPRPMMRALEIVNSTNCTQSAKLVGTGLAGDCRNSDSMRA
jgi:hypothetical protein